MYMYITFINKAGEVETRYSKPTKKNKKAIEGMLPSIYYLYEEAEKVLAKGDILKEGLLNKWQNFIKTHFQ